MMQNTNDKRINSKEEANMYYDSNQESFYNTWQEYIDSFKNENKTNQANITYQCSGNEIFAICTIITILFISIGGNILIRNRTKQQLIYNAIPQASTTISQ
jgi:hypothetical protein